MGGEASFSSSRSPNHGKGRTNKVKITMRLAGQPALWVPDQWCCCLVTDAIKSALSPVLQKLILQRCVLLPDGLLKLGKLPHVNILNHDRPYSWKNVTLTEGFLATFL